MKWKKFFKDLWQEIMDDDIFSGAAAIAYYLMLATFPGLIALLSLLPYFPVQNLKTEIFGLMGEALPSDAASLISRTLDEISARPQGGLLSFGLIAALWVASSGVYAIMQQLNISYDVKEGRAYWRVRSQAVLLTMVFGLLITVAFTLIVVGGLSQEWLSEKFNWSVGIVTLFAFVRWLIVAGMLLASFALVYFYGPDVKQKFKFITPGSILGTIGIAISSMAFRFYVGQFANYSATYGSLGAVIVLMVWLYITGLVILLGSEVNALLEHYAPDGKDKGEKIKGEERQEALSGSLLHPSPRNV